MSLRGAALRTLLAATPVLAQVSTIQHDTARVPVGRVFRPRMVGE